MENKTQKAPKAENIEKEEKAKEVKKAKPKKNDELVQMKKTNDELNDKLLRVMAELQNVRRRGSEEVASLKKYEGEAILHSLLDVRDDFERALTINGDISEELKKFLDGFEMIYAALVGIITNNGIEEINCLNEEFDPNTAMAVLTEKSTDVLPGVVVDVLQKGYRLRDKVIRPAMVKVSE